MLAVLGGAFSVLQMFLLSYNYGTIIIRVLATLHLSLKLKLISLINNLRWLPFQGTGIGLLHYMLSCEAGDVHV